MIFNLFNFDLISNMVSTANSVGYNVFIYLCIYLTGSSIVISLINNGIMETYLIKRHNIDKLVLIYLSILMNNVLLLLISISIYIISNNKLIIVHYILLIISIILINKKNNIEVLIICVLICIDIISIINIMIILSGNNMWYYMLYQSIMSMYMWYSYIGSVYLILICIYYYKLGLGIGGYYIPGLYSNMMNKIYIFIYIGLANIVLMYNPILLFNIISSMSISMILFNFILVLIIIYIWISSGYIYMDIWLYCISFSTIILSNIYYLLCSIDIIYYNLYYYLYYFTISSMIIWFIFIYTLYYVNYNSNNNSGYIILDCIFHSLYCICIYLLYIYINNIYISMLYNNNNNSISSYISISNNISNNIYIDNSIIILILGLIMLNNDNMIRSVFGLIFSSMSIVIYMLSNGYIIICILIGISIISISLIIFVLYYNSINIYKSDNNISILICVIYTVYVYSLNTDTSLISLPLHESISYIVILNSNMLISILILCLFIFIICIYRLNTGISYTYLFNIVSIMMIDIYLLLVVALLICYIPIIIRYSSSIYKWSSDIYEVGIGVNNSNSQYMSTGSLNIGSYLFYFMIYVFLLLDIIINILIISNILYSNIYINSIIIFSTLLSMYYLLNIYSVMYFNNNNNSSVTYNYYIIYILLVLCVCVSNISLCYNTSSIYSVLYILIILLIVLSISSLLTVLERKVLGSSQRRLGPSYNGWFGLIQIVMDGIKLIYKDYSIHNNINNKYIVLSSIISFVFSYLLFVLIYIDIYCNISISYILLIILLILMINHIGIVLCGIVISNNKWTILSSIRLVLLYIQYDILFVLIIVYLGSYNINNVIESSDYYMNCIKYPILFSIYIYIVLMEAGRIPIDIIEAESELIAGYSIEYSGFLYALFASAEYSIVLFHCYLLSILYLGYYNNIVFILLLFIIMVIIRSTLPRFKYTDLYYVMYYYVYPIVLLYLVLNINTLVICVIIYLVYFIYCLLF